PEPRVELADPIAHLAHLADEGFGILTSTLPFPDLLRHRVAASLQRVGFGDQRASLLVQYEDPGHGAVGFLGGAAQPKAFANLFRALADPPQVEHSIERNEAQIAAQLVGHELDLEDP